MNKTNLICSVLISFSLLSGCDKEDLEEMTFSGVVERQSTDCQGANGAGKAMIIKIDNGMPYENIYTLTLPSDFKIIGNQIKFNARELEEKDEGMLCNTSVIGAKQFVVYNVK